MTFESRSDVSIAEYFRMIGLKTGALITFSCRSGAMLASGSSDQVEALSEFGRHFGLAFQIFDDLRGIWAESQQTGKAEAKDILNRKKSLPVLLAFDRATGRDREQLRDYYAGSEDIPSMEVFRIIDRLDVKPEVMHKLADNLEEGCRALARGQLKPDIVTQLHELAWALVDCSSLTGS